MAADSSFFSKKEGKRKKGKQQLVACSQSQKLPASPIEIHPSAGDKFDKSFYFYGAKVPRAKLILRLADDFYMSSYVTSIGTDRDLKADFSFNKEKYQIEKMPDSHFRLFPLDPSNRWLEGVTNSYYKERVCFVLTIDLSCSDQAKFEQKLQNLRKMMKDIYRYRSEQNPDILVVGVKEPLPVSHQSSDSAVSTTFKEIAPFEERHKCELINQLMKECHIPEENLFRVCVVTGEGRTELLMRMGDLAIERFIENNPEKVKSTASSTDRPPQALPLRGVLRSITGFFAKDANPPVRDQLTKGPFSSTPSQGTQ